jgi:hypothetical protein
METIRVDLSCKILLENIHISVIYIFYKNKKSKLYFEDRVSVLKHQIS